MEAIRERDLTKLENRRDSLASDLANLQIELRGLREHRKNLFLDPKSPGAELAKAHKEIGELESQEKQISDTVDALDREIHLIRQVMSAAKLHDHKVDKVQRTIRVREMELEVCDHMLAIGELFYAAKTLGVGAVHRTTFELGMKRDTIRDLFKPQVERELKALKVELKTLSNGHK